MLPSRASLLQVLFLSLAAGLFAVGCGGDEEDKEDDDGIPGSQAPCQDDNISFVGTIDGAAVDVLYPYTSFSFVQLGDQPRFDVDFTNNAGAAGSLNLTWAELVANGDTTAVSGTITWPSESGGPSTSFTAAPGSVLTPTGEDSYIFSLDLGGENHLDGCAMSVF